MPWDNRWLKIWWTRPTMFLSKDSFAEWKIPKSGKRADVRLSEPESGWISNDSVIHSTCLGQEREEVGMLYDVNVWCSCLTGGELRKKKQEGEGRGRGGKAERERRDPEFWANAICMVTSCLPRITQLFWFVFSKFLFSMVWKEGTEMGYCQIF